MVTAGVHPGVYVGSLRHRRMAPVAHEFTYPLFMVLLDIDRIPELMRESLFTGYNRWNWASYHEADHFGDPGQPLRTRLVRDAARHGLTLPDGPIFLLTHLRYLGYCFNPVSFFFCHDTAGRLGLVLAEVNNTFGGAHNYWLEPVPLSGRGPFTASAAKAFYVSPFMPADLRYSFRFTSPLDSLVVHMVAEQARTGCDVEHRFDATLRLERRPWSSGAIRDALMRFPVMTAAVMAGIHWEAVRLWWKGLPVVPRPTPDGVRPDYVAPRPGQV
jgi:uncharacterized protein